MSSDDSDYEDIPKRLRMNMRQHTSEIHYKSFQSVWSKSRVRPTRTSPNALPDPVPMPAPGRDNLNCLYNKDDITIKYRIEKDVMVPDTVRTIEGVVYNFRCPRNVKWKWLVHYAHSLMSNKLFRHFTCPYGCFEIQDHTINAVYFPNRQRKKFAADFTCTMKIRGSYYHEVDYDNPINVKNRKQDIESGQWTPYQFAYFRNGLPLGMKDIKFDNIKDTYRYCYAFDYVLDRNDKRFAIDGREFSSANDMWLYCIENIFDTFKKHLGRAHDILDINRHNRNRFYTLHEEYSNNLNYISYKDIPNKAYMDTFNFKRGHFIDNNPNVDSIKY